ncbi:hypothetical protein M408DRAFT_81703 [Serendipita vermifera MAFF 305830]|uniref:CHAT domain-containing protein n=1 Tax=Serendipita vermifera MAFF 305830 TaxID=933852 RepID=A0A0C3A7P1_SERVB|nr:hypothetical protein M408DRAFT_81703 [Serendipita vermifera MAFF 305830]
MEEHKAEDFSKAEGEESHSPEFLENNYTKVHRLGDRNARAHPLNLIGCGFLKLYYDNGAVAHLERAISILEESMECTSLFDSRLAEHSSDLGSALLQRFILRNNMVDIEKATVLCQNAVKVTNDSDPNIHKWLNNIANCYASRFDRLGKLEDINKAISTWKRSVRLMGDSDPKKHVALGGAGASFLRRFEQSGNLRDINEAISFQQAAVDLTPDGHPDKPSWLNNLGSAVQIRFERLGDVMDLENAISFLQAAVDLTPDDVMDLENAISFKQAAVDLTPDGHPDKPARLSNLGNTFVHRFRNSHLSTHLQSAIISFSTAANSLTGPSVIRFRAACTWGGFSHLYGQSPVPAFECAINLLPQVAWLGTSLTTQHAQLIEAGDVVRYAVSVAIELEEYERAAQWAEYGRSIVWQNLFSLRTPLDDLHNAHPELAMRLQSISQQLEGSLSDSHLPKDSEPGTLQDLASTATRFAVEREEIIEKVRKMPGFEYFLKAKSFDKLAPAAHEGPVSIINIHQLRCDALVLIPHDSQALNVSIVHIPLESFTHVMSETLFRDFNKLLSSTGVRARDTRKSEREAPVRDNEGSFRSILHSLWHHVVKPVLDGLAYQVRLLTRQSRIWWCATGPLAFLPIHAAGNYDSDVVGEKVSDYVISSYTPTLTALLDQSQPEMASHFQILTVAQPSTPHALPLPETEREVGLVKDIASGVAVKSLINEEATTARVLQAMKESNWIHLACHGIQDHKESLKSGFLLHDKILELAELIREPLPKADFAFLSACQTAKGDEKIAEESVHLAAGMLFSGCKGVIGTMWSIQDNDAPKVTKIVYERMLKDGVPNRKEAARALHEAVKELRESGADFLSWVPFIHMGR